MDKVVRHRCVYDIVGESFGHVTTYTASRRSMGRNGRKRACDGGMALQSRGSVVALGLRSARNIVRVVTGCAFQRTRTCQKTSRYPQTVGCPGDLELFVLASSFRMVEVQHIVRRWLARPKRKYPAIVADQAGRKAETGCLQMALHA